MTQGVGTSGALEIVTKVLDIEKPVETIKMDYTGGNQVFGDLREFLKEQIGENVELVNTFPPINSAVDFGRVEIIDLPVTGKARVNVGEIEKLKTKYFPLGVVDFFNLMKNKHTYTPDVLKKESKVFLFVGTKIVQTVPVFDRKRKEKFEKKEFFLCVLFHRGRLCRAVHSLDQACDFKTLVVKRPQIQ